MGKRRVATFDPNATNYALDMLVGGIEDKQLSLEDLSNPTAVQLLLMDRKTGLVNLQERERETGELRKEKDSLLVEREELRVKVATLEERAYSLGFEIPASMLVGYALNLLANNAADRIGWVLLFVGVTMVVILRGGRPIMKALGRTRMEKG